MNHHGTRAADATTDFFERRLKPLTAALVAAFTGFGSVAGYAYGRGVSAERMAARITAVELRVTSVEETQKQIQPMQVMIARIDERVAEMKKVSDGMAAIYLPRNPEERVRLMTPPKNSSP